MGARSVPLDDATGSSFLDFLIEIAPGLNLLLLAFFGAGVGKARKAALETGSEIRKIHRSITIAEENGYSRGYDSVGDEWVRVKSAVVDGKRFNDPEKGN